MFVFNWIMQMMHIGFCEREELKEKEVISILETTIRHGAIEGKALNSDML